MIIPRIDLYANITKEKTIVKNEDGSYDEITTITRRITPEAVKAKVLSKEAEITEVKTVFPDVFKVVKEVEEIEKL